ncbi:MAG: tetratricopeptide repeat protein [Elusimicrobia bacterium]|nr:tetratricopeptide repeat protein [Elusimicrobiota bacterium]
MRKIIIISVLSLVFLARGVYTIKDKSATYDEPYYIGYGYSLLKTCDFRLRKDKTTLVPVISALPLLLLDLDFPAGSAEWGNSDTRKIKDVKNWAQAEETVNAVMFCYKLLYENRVPADTILFYARLPILLIALTLGLFVYKWAARMYGETAGIISFILYTNMPDILAHGSLATEDMALACFMFITVYMLWKFRESGAYGDLVFAGISAGLALDSKYTAVIIVPLSVLYIAAGRKDHEPVRRQIGRVMRETSVMLGAAFLVLLLLYGFTGIKEYFHGMSFSAAYIKRSQASFLAGRYSYDGFRRYFLYAFLIKTPLSFIGILLLAAWAFLKKPGRKYIEASYIFILPVALFITASFSPMHIGHRHILPVYPFLMVFAGGAVRLKSAAAITAAAVLTCLTIVSSALIHPHYLAYFNSLAGGADKGYRYLVDSNMDWGQDLKGLKRYVKEEGVSDVILSYYGGGMTDYLGFEFQDLYSFGLRGDTDHVNSAAPEKEILAVSATNLKGVYMGKVGHDILSWLENREPDDKIGYSVFIYDVTRYADAHKYLSHVYFKTRQYEKAEREALRAAAIDPAYSDFSSLMLGMIYALRNMDNMAVKSAGRFLDSPGRDKTFEEMAGLIKNRLDQEAYSAGLASLAYMLLSENKLESTMLVSRLCMTVDRENVNPYVYMGIVYERSGQPEKAVEVLNRAVKVDSSVKEVYYNLAVCYYRMKDNEKAAANIEKVLKIDPGYIEALRFKRLLGR